jgi:hypothetical protein
MKPALQLRVSLQADVCLSTIRHIRTFLLCIDGVKFSIQSCCSAVINFSAGLMRTGKTLPIYFDDNA